MKIRADLLAGSRDKRHGLRRTALLAFPILSTLCLFFQLKAAADGVPAPAQPHAAQAVLVELFTSEGCSSCPPADRLLKELDQKQPIAGATIVVLSEHVDYWNSLGWRDPYSSHQWSERQDDYGRQFGLESVYTPQIVIDGSHQAVGSDYRAIQSAVEESARTPHLQFAISGLVRTERSVQLNIYVGAAPGSMKGGAVYAVIADSADRSSVERGENAGRTLEHVAVARSLTRVADLGAAPLDSQVEIALPPDAGSRRLRLILFARDSNTGHIVGTAAREL